MHEPCQSDGGGGTATTEGVLPENQEKGGGQAAKVAPKKRQQPGCPLPFGRSSQFPDTRRVRSRLGRTPQILATPTWFEAPMGGNDVLLLSRKCGQSIVINDDTVVTIVSVDRNRVRLGIRAPGCVPIFRQEVVERMVAAGEIELPECLDGEKTTVAVGQ